MANVPCSCSRYDFIHVREPQCQPFYNTVKPSANPDFDALVAIAVKRLSETLSRSEYKEILDLLERLTSNEQKQSAL